MESNQVGELIGQEVWWEKEKKMADIVGYEKGWVTIKTDDGEEHKVRAKDIILMDTDDDLKESDGGLEVVAPDSKGPQTIPDGEVLCQCGLCFHPPKQECFKCPDCGKWHRVRLHPDLGKYVKGMAATASGRDTVDIDDDVATMLRSLDISELYKVVCEELVGIDENIRFSKSMTSAFAKSGMSCADFLQERYEDRNLGMQRMNLGNLLRGAYKRQAKISGVAEPEEAKSADTGAEE